MTEADGASSLTYTFNVFAGPQDAVVYFPSQAVNFMNFYDSDVTSSATTLGLFGVTLGLSYLMTVLY